MFLYWFYKKNNQFIPINSSIMETSRIYLRKFGLQYPLYQYLARRKGKKMYWSKWRKKQNQQEKPQMTPLMFDLNTCLDVQREKRTREQRKVFTILIPQIFFKTFSLTWIQLTEPCSKHSFKKNFSEQLSIRCVFFISSIALNTMLTSIH